MTNQTRPRTFRLIRKKDVSGVSGTGYIAEGVVFHDGMTFLKWFGKIPSVEEFPTVENVLEIHGHGGSTDIEWWD